MTVREALDEKRRQWAGKLRGLVWCKRELFYLPAEGHTIGHSPDDSVYPVSKEIVAAEAEFFGIEWSEQ